MEREHIASIDDINRRVLAWNYGALDSEHRPSLIDPANNNLGQGGLQMFNLFIRFNCMFDDYSNVKDMNEKFTLISVVCRIFQIAGSTEIDECNLIEFDELVKELFELSVIHLQKWDKSEKTLKSFDFTPKLHLLTHYTTVIRKLGPVCFASTLRCECKHGFYKNLASQVKNQSDFLNFAFTKHQENWAMEWSNTGDFSRIETSAEKMVYNPDKILQGILEDECLQRVKWIECSYSFTAGRFFSKKDISTEFYLIIDLFTLTKINKKEKQYFVQCRKAITQYSSFYRGYEILDFKIELLLLNLMDLQNLETFEATKSKETGKNYLICKKNCLN